ncbi:MAG: PBP1A family penicillin-binding protein [Candidatus Binatia bacterium]
MARAERRGGGWFRRLFLWTSTAGLLAAGLVGFVLYREITSSLPPVDQLLRYQPPVTTRIFSDDGTLIGELYVERRYLVPLDAIPPHVRLAFLAAEDAEFYRHHGVNPLSIVRALVNNVVRGQHLQGGSTITQQVVKNLLLTPERSYERKLKELILATRLETKLSKDDILYLYLNQIYFGGGAYGIAAAARAFFDVDVGDLTIAQAALLAGLPQKPSGYDPQRHPKQAVARQHYVLARMRDEGFVTREQYEAAVAEELAFTPRRPATYIAAPWYVEQVRRMLEDRYGGAASQLGLRVYTAVDLRLQKAAEEALRNGLRELDQRQGFRGPIRRVDAKKAQAYLAHEAAEHSPADPVHRGIVLEVRPGGLTVRTAWEHGVLPADGLAWGKARVSPQSFKPGDVIAVTVAARAPDGSVRFALDQEPQVQGALVAFDPYTGQVKAMVGGYDFGRTQFNRALQARRQPGSSIKPLIYAAAIEHGYTPASIVLDAPISLPNGNQPAWTPKNFKNQYFGNVPLREALQRSLNTVTVRLVQAVGLDPVRQYLGRFGFSTPMPRNMSLALGSAEVTPLELTRAYGVFATQGKRFDPIFVTAVTDGDGNPLPFTGTRPHFEPVMRPAVAYVLTSLMESVVQHGTGRKAAELGRPVAGKTGTTNDTHDAWFIGFTPDTVAGVWVGFDAERSLGSNETGGHAAAPIWTAFMKQALADQPIVDFHVPEGVTFAQVDPASGLRAVPGGASRLEVFVEGTEPTEYASAPSEEGEAGTAHAAEPPPDGAD